MAVNPTGEFERTAGGAVLMDGIRLRGEIIAGLYATIEAAGSPPVSTKSPREISSLTTNSRTRSSTPL